METIFIIVAIYFSLFALISGIYSSAMRENIDLGRTMAISLALPFLIFHIIGILLGIALYSIAGLRFKFRH